MVAQALPAATVESVAPARFLVSLRDEFSVQEAEVEESPRVRQVSSEVEEVVEPSPTVPLSLAEYQSTPTPLEILGGLFHTSVAPAVSQEVRDTGDRLSGPVVELEAALPGSKEAPCTEEEEAATVTQRPEPTPSFQERRSMAETVALEDRVQPQDLPDLFQAEGVAVAQRPPLQVELAERVRFASRSTTTEKGSP